MRAGLAGLLVAGTTLLAACGGGSDSSGTTRVRMVNATVGVSSLDLYGSDSLLLSGVGHNAASAYKDAATGNYTIKATHTGSATALSSASPTFEKDIAYTVVAWGLAGATQTFYFPDNEEAPSAGLAKVRLFNTSLDAGALDLYLTAANADLGSATPVVTANGSKTDVRLDLPSVTLSALDVLTLITQPSQSGMLVHGLQLLQKGAVTANPNTQARVRLVASVAGNGAVTANVGSSSLNVGLPSPSVGSYVLVPAGSQVLSAQVSATALTPETQSLMAGGDYTLLAHGPLAAPKLPLIADDNRLPSSSTTTTNGSATMINILQQGVYTLFMLDGAASPSGALRRER